MMVFLGYKDLMTVVAKEMELKKISMIRQVRYSQMQMVAFQEMQLRRTLMEHLRVKSKKELILMLWIENPQRLVAFLNSKNKGVNKISLTNQMLHLTKIARLRSLLDLTLIKQGVVVNPVKELLLITLLSRALKTQ